MTSEGVSKSRLQNSLLLIFVDKSITNSADRSRLLNMDQSNLGLHCLEIVIHVDSKENSVRILASRCREIIT